MFKRQLLSRGGALLVYASITRSKDVSSLQASAGAKWFHWARRWCKSIAQRQWCTSCAVPPGNQYMASMLSLDIRLLNLRALVCAAVQITPSSMCSVHCTNCTFLETYSGSSWAQPTHVHEVQNARFQQNRCGPFRGLPRSQGSINGHNYVLCR